jgi:hypothetical protein
MTLPPEPVNRSAERIAETAVANDIGTGAIFLRQLVPSAPGGRGGRHLDQRRVAQ